jgi:hypothetical protein
MKLNLVPKTVAKGVAARNALIISILLVVLNLFLALFSHLSHTARLQEWKSAYDQKQVEAQKVVETSKKADEVIRDATIILTNTALVNEIRRANTAYPDLYDEIREYIPSFFRVRRMEAVSSGPGTATVTITGYLKTFEQYSDIMIALLRYPKAIGVGRAGFNPVPPDQEGPFGYSPDVPFRGPAPGWSEVQIFVSVRANLQAPDPMPTLQAASAAAVAPQAPTTPAGGAPTPAGGAPAGGTTPVTPRPPGAGGAS